MEGSEERYMHAVAESGSPRPNSPRPIVVLGTGGIARTAHLPAYAKAEFPVIAVADSYPGRASELAAERQIARSFESVAEAVRFAPVDAVFDVAVAASPILAVLPA